MFSRYSSLILVKTTDVGAMWLYTVTGDFTKPERLSRCPPPPHARAIEEYDKLVLLRRALFSCRVIQINRQSQNQVLHAPRREILSSSLCGSARIPS